MHWFEVRDKINKIYHSCRRTTQYKMAYKYSAMLILKYCPTEYMYRYLTSLNNRYNNLGNT